MDRYITQVDNRKKLITTPLRTISRTYELIAAQRSRLERGTKMHLKQPYVPPATIIFRHAKPRYFIDDIFHRA